MTLVFAILSIWDRTADNDRVLHDDLKEQRKLKQKKKQLNAKNDDIVYVMNSKQ